jgi:hypothetical protein
LWRTLDDHIKNVVERCEHVEESRSERLQADPRQEITSLMEGSTDPAADDLRSGDGRG